MYYHRRARISSTSRRKPEIKIYRFDSPENRGIQPWNVALVLHNEMNDHEIWSSDSTAAEDSSLLGCGTKMDITILQNGGEKSEQHGTTSQKTGIFILNINSVFKDYSLSINLFTFLRQFAFTQACHTTDTWMSVQDHYLVALRQHMLMDQGQQACTISSLMCWSASWYYKQPDVLVSQLPGTVLQAAWRVGQPAARHCTASSMEDHHHYWTQHQCNYTSYSVLFLPK